MSEFKFALFVILPKRERFVISTAHKRFVISTERERVEKSVISSGVVQ